MPTSCAAYGCTAVFKKNTNVSFHRFPSNACRRTEWIQLVQRENFKPGKYTYLCSRHFESTCFDRTGQTRRLREDAVPTIFDFPPHLQDKECPGPEERNQNRENKSYSLELLHNFESPYRRKKLYKLHTGKSEQIPEGDCTKDGPSKADPKSSFSSKDVFLEHSYCLDNPIAAKRKIFQLQDEVEILRKKIKISKQRERRVAKKWSGVNNLLENLKEKNVVPHIKVEEPIQPTLSDKSFQEK